MRLSTARIIAAAALAVCSVTAETVAANHHFMQIHQVIGGVNGDTAAQAVQLRMRAGFQDQMQLAKLWAFDANGENPVLLIDFPTSVPNHGAGVTVLIATTAFADQTDPPCAPDFIMTNPIPDSYLAAGSLTFEDNAGLSIWWRLSWGGPNYTGPTTGAITNDSDGDFGVYPDVLPSSSLAALLFQGGPTDRSTNNADDYDITPDAAVFTNNAGKQCTVVGSGGGGEICPDLSTILAGFERNGTSADICDSDDTRWEIQSTTFAAVFTPAPIQIEFNGNVGAGGPNLTFTVEGHPGLGGGTAFLRLLMWNFTTGQFDGIPFVGQPDGPPDVIYELTVDNSGGDYVDVDGGVKAKLEAAKTADGPVRMLIDQAFWTLD